VLQSSPVLLALALGVAAVAGQGQSRAPIVQSVDLSVPFAPVTFVQNGQTQLVYELHITNFQQVDVALASVRVNTPAGMIAELLDDELRKQLVRPGLRNDYPTPHIIGPGMRAVLNLWIELPASSVPSVTHVVELDLQRPSGAVHATVESGASQVAAPFEAQGPTVLDAPLRRGPWVAIYDPLLKGGHRTAIYTIDGRARIPGRFAIDFVALPQSGALPPLAERATANGFGADVLAVADGTIAAAMDGTPDTAVSPVPPESASGNYIALEIGSRRIAVYEHLQQGSIVVRPGQRVTRGQVMAKLGSSGSTSIGPHLHFHLADTNSLLGAEGLPFVFNLFTVMGEFASIDSLQRGEAWRPARAASWFTKNRPAPNTVIHFP
jgi:murein DD-endopeptidase